jgi:hypothetical protein
MDNANSFDSALKEIRISELLGVLIISVILIVVVGLDLQWIMIFTIIYILYRTRNNLDGLKCCADNLFSKISFKTWILLGITSYIFALGSGYIFTDIIPLESYIFGFMSITSNLSAVGVDFLSTVIVGPIFEELVFRGIILNRLNRRMHLILAILIPSILFALFHPYTAQLSCLIFAITMCIAYLISGNILIPITLHMLNNLISMLVPYIPNIIKTINSQIGGTSLIILTTISLVYILIFIIRGYREVKSL